MLNNINSITFQRHRLRNKGHLSEKQIWVSQNESVPLEIIIEPMGYKSKYQYRIQSSNKFDNSLKFNSIFETGFENRKKAKKDIQSRFKCNVYFPKEIR